MQIDISGRVGCVIALALGHWVPVIAVVLAFEHPLLAVCGQTGVALQVLGSGGPRGRDDRAQAGYLVWVDGKARVKATSPNYQSLSLSNLGGSLQHVRENYRGRFVVAKDLECVPVRKAAKRR